MSDSKVYDAIIIGAGPAGMTAAMYCARAGLSCAMIEMLAAGGQMALTEHLENYPGYTSSTSGFDLSEVMSNQAVSFGAELIYGQVKKVDLHANPKILHTSSGDLLTNTVIIATGARAAKLGVDGEKELTGLGVSYCATCDGNFFRNQTVVVVGGGDTAAADAIYLSRLCKKVYVIVRRDVLRATAIYNSRLQELENVEIIWNTIVTSIIEEDGAVGGVNLHDRVTDQDSKLDCAAVFVAIGTEPNVEFLDGILPIDHTGHIEADSMGKTSIPGVFVAGDVRSKELYQVTTAVADGANAADEAARYVMLARDEGLA